MLALALSVHENSSGLDIPTFGECAKDADVVVAKSENSKDGLDIKVITSRKKSVSGKTDDEYVSCKLKDLLNNQNNSDVIKVTPLGLDEKTGELILVNVSILDSINLACIREKDDWRIILHNSKYSGKIGIDCGRVDMAGNVAIKDLVVHSSDDYVSNLGKLYIENCKILSKYIANYGLIKHCTNFFQNSYVDLIDEDSVTKFAKQNGIDETDLLQTVRSLNLTPGSFNELFNLLGTNALKANGRLFRDFNSLDIFRMLSQDADITTGIHYEIYQLLKDRNLGFFNAIGGRIESEGSSSCIKTTGFDEVDLLGYVKVNKWVSDNPIRIGAPLIEDEYVNKFIFDEISKCNIQQESSQNQYYNCSFNYLYAPWVSVDATKFYENSIDGSIWSSEEGIWSSDMKFSIKYPNTKVVAMSNRNYVLPQTVKNEAELRERPIKKVLSGPSDEKFLLPELTFDISDSLFRTVFKKACRHGIITKLRGLGFNVKNQTDNANQCSEYELNVVDNYKRSVPVKAVFTGNNPCYYDQDGTRYNSAVISKIWYQTLLKKDKTNHKPFENIVLDIAEEVTGLSREDFINQLRAKCTIDKEKIDKVVNQTILKAKNAYDEIANFLGFGVISSLVHGSTWFRNEDVQKINNLKTRCTDQLRCLGSFLVSVGCYKEGEGISIIDILKKSDELLPSVFISKTFNPDSRKVRDEICGLDETYQENLKKSITTQVEKNLIYDVFSDIEF